MECKAEQEKVRRPKTGASHDKRRFSWEVVSKAQEDKKAQKRRKLRARTRRKAYRDFIEKEFIGVSILELT